MRSLAAIGRAGAAVMLFTGALFTTQLSVPSVAAACACITPDSAAEVVGNPDIVVVTGTIAAVQIANGPFGPQFAEQLTVLRVFQGEIPLGPVPIRGGGGEGSCIPELEGGAHVVLTATIVGDRLELVPCGLFGLLTTPEGQALLQDFEAAFGQAARPPPIAAEPAADLATIAIIAVAGVVILVLVGAFIAVLGRRDRAAAP